MTTRKMTTGGNMDTKKVDRRVRKTRKQLRDGLARLMEKKSIRDIKVKELVEEVDINRSTFYLHYSDIYDMLSKIEEELIEEIEEALRQYPLGEGRKSMDFLCRMFEIMEENREIYKALCGQNGDANFVVRLENMVGSEALRSLATLFEQVPKREISFLYAYCLNGCLGMVKMWLIYDGKETPEEMAGLMVRMVTNTLREYHDAQEKSAIS